MVRRASNPGGDRPPAAPPPVDNTRNPVALDPNGRDKDGQPTSPQGRAADTLMDGSMLMMPGGPGGPGAPGMPGMPPAPDFSLCGPDDPEEEEEE